MLLYHIVAHFSLWCIMINFDKITGNEEEIDAKENLKGTFTQDSSLIMFYLELSFTYVAHSFASHG